MSVTVFLYPSIDGGSNDGNIFAAIYIHTKICKCIHLTLTYYNGTVILTPIYVKSEHISAIQDMVTHINYIS